MGSATPLDLPAAATQSAQDNPLLEAVQQHLSACNFQTQLGAALIIDQYQKWLKTASDEERAKFLSYRKVLDIFKPEERLQFLGDFQSGRWRPSEKLIQFDSYPDALFADLHLNKAELLDFLGWSVYIKLRGGDDDEEIEIPEELEQLTKKLRRSHEKTYNDAEEIIKTLQLQRADIDRRLTFSATPTWLRESLEARRAKIDHELAELAFVQSGIASTQMTPVAKTPHMTVADLKWPAPIPLGDAQPAEHDPKNVPPDILETYHRYARINEHTAVMLLWNPQTRHYELERGWPQSPAFDTSKQLVRTALPTFIPTQSIGAGLGFAWYFAPDHDHLKLHEQWGVAPSEPLIIDTLMRGDDGEAIVIVQLEALQQTPPSPTDHTWRSYVMHFKQTFAEGDSRESQFLVAYEYGSPLSNRRLLMNFKDVLATPSIGKIAPGFITPGIDDKLGSEGKISVHLQPDEATHTMKLEFHANLIPPTFSEQSTMFMLVEYVDQRHVYRFNSHDIIDILQKAPKAGEESYRIYEKKTRKPATVHTIDGQIKSITIEGHTEWYDLPVNQITIPLILPGRPL